MLNNWIEVSNDRPCALLNSLQNERLCCIQDTEFPAKWTTWKNRHQWELFQLTCLRPWLLLKWSLSRTAWPKRFGHSLQANFRWPSCTFLTWDFNVSLRLKAFPQKHEKGFTPVNFTWNEDLFKNSNKESTWMLMLNVNFQPDSTN